MVQQERSVDSATRGIRDYGVLEGGGGAVKHHKHKQQQE